MMMELLPPIDALSWHVLDATADDWESIDQIEPHVCKYCDGFDRRSIATRILELSQTGLMREMQHETLEHEAVTADDILKQPTEHWFGMTEEGRVLWDADGSKYRDE